MKLLKNEDGFDAIDLIFVIGAITICVTIILTMVQSFIVDVTKDAAVAVIEEKVDDVKAATKGKVDDAKKEVAKSKETFDENLEKAKENIQQAVAKVNDKFKGFKVHIEFKKGDEELQVGEEKKEEVASNENIKPFPQKFEYDGHTYIKFNEDDPPVHDPECKCTQETTQPQKEERDWMAYPD